MCIRDRFMAAVVQNFAKDDYIFEDDNKSVHRPHSAMEYRFRNKIKTFVVIGADTQFKSQKV